MQNSACAIMQVQWYYYFSLFCSPQITEINIWFISFQSENIKTFKADRWSQISALIVSLWGNIPFHYRLIS